MIITLLWFTQGNIFLQPENKTFIVPFTLYCVSGRFKLISDRDEEEKKVFVTFNSTLNKRKLKLISWKLSHH